jgi:hypothetical protein
MITTVKSSTSIKYSVVWFSPRGFANEGGYYYGTEAEAEKLHADYDQYRAKYSFVSDHRTLDAAKAKAEKLAKRDRRATPSHEICNIDAIPFAHLQG